jgi:hypothetical protein
VELRSAGKVFGGWTLNLSRGGARLVLVEEEEGAVAEGVDCTIEIDGDPSGARPAHVVWVQNEPDGQIAGVKFLDVEDGAPP